MSIVNLWCSVFLLPNGCLEELEKNCSAFLWSGAPNSAKDAKVSWVSICTLKKPCGLGLKRLVDWNKVFALKLIWLLFTVGGSLWVYWVKKHLIKDRVFWYIDFQNLGSWLWKRLVKVRPLARPFLSAILGSGTSILFWHDDWYTLGPLIEIPGLNGPQVSGILSSAIVVNSEWSLPRGRHALVVLLRACLPSPPNTQSGIAYNFLWKVNSLYPPSVFSSPHTWRSLHLLGIYVSWKPVVWFKRYIPTHALSSGWLYIVS